MFERSGSKAQYVLSLFSHADIGLRYLQFQVQAGDEDIHTANERRLTELIGPVGGKLHTGRSRNDQVATDMRLWLMGEAGDIVNSVKALLRVMVERAAKEIQYLMPGYTHLQVRSTTSTLTRAR